MVLTLTLLLLSQAPEGVDDELPSEELESLRALEETALEAPDDGPAPLPTLNLREEAARLGLGSLTRDRLEAVLDDAQFTGEELAFELARVTDVDAFDISTVADQYDIPVEMQPLV